MAFYPGNSEVYIVDVESQQRTNISQHPSTDSQPSWSPDGKSLAFVSIRDLNPEIYVADLQTGALVNLSDNLGQDTDPAWSPDSKRLAYVSRQSLWSQIIIADLETGELMRKGSAAALAPTRPGHPMAASWPMWPGAEVIPTLWCTIWRPATTSMSATTR